MATTNRLPSVSNNDAEQSAGRRTIRSRFIKLIGLCQTLTVISVSISASSGSLAALVMLPTAHSSSAGSNSNATTSTTTSEPARQSPVNGQQTNNIETGALSYLKRYGYMSSTGQHRDSNQLISEESFSSAVADFQRFAGLPATGLVDRQTVEWMQMPRCGNSDKPGPPDERARVSKAGRLSRKRRYALQGSKWRRQELTYRISQYPSRFNGKRHEVDEQIARAFGVWSRVAPIDFVVKREGRVHIDIRFASGDHGDGDAFDGPGNTLAHAYFPQYGGDAHFDDQEYWTIDSYTGTNIFQVAAHELGHSLGLGHSNVREALMAPFYQKYKPNFKLHVDDILAIQALYGEKLLTGGVGGNDDDDDNEPGQATGSTTTSTTSSSTTTTTTSTSTTTTTEAPPASTRSDRFPIYKGGRRPFEPPFGGQTPPGGQQDEEGNGNALPHDQGGNGIGGFADYPADLCSDPAIDAVTRTEDGSSYVFKGDHYWLLTQDGLAKGYPRPIGSDWHGLPGNLDAALTWADGKTFFFKGNKYWRFRNKRRDLGYPKLISSGFAGIPDDIDAAFVWGGNGRTYFFKGHDYWRFDSKADPPVSSEYPRPIKVWLGVPSHVNAAFRWDNNVTYFFKGNQYYRFNDREFRVEARGRPPFPRATAEWWFGCVGSNLAQRALPPTEPAVRRAPGLAQGVAGRQTNQEAPDWSFLAGLEDTGRSMGTHISDHSRPPVGTAEQSNSGNSANDRPEGPSLAAGGDNDQPVVTADGPTGLQATHGARQPRQRQQGARPNGSQPQGFEDFGWPLPRPRGGDIGPTLFSHPQSTPGYGNPSRAKSSATSPIKTLTSTTLLSSAILITCLQQLFTALISRAIHCGHHTSDPGTRLATVSLIS